MISFRGMTKKIFVAGILINGHVAGTTIIEAPSAEYIRSHPHKFVGEGRAIGRIVPTNFKNIPEAVEASHKAYGYHVENGVRVYDSPEQYNTPWDEASKPL